MIYLNIFIFVVITNTALCYIQNKDDWLSPDTTTRSISDAVLCYKNVIGNEDIYAAMNGLLIEDVPNYIFLNIDAETIDAQNNKKEKHANHFMSLQPGLCSSTLIFSPGTNPHSDVKINISVNTGDKKSSIANFSLVININSKEGINMLTGGNVFFNIFYELKLNKEIIQESKALTTLDVRKALDSSFFQNDCVCFICGFKFFVIPFVRIDSNERIRPFSKIVIEIVERDKTDYLQSCASWSCSCRIPNRHAIHGIYVNRDLKMAEVQVSFAPFQYPIDDDLTFNITVPRQAFKLNKNTINIEWGFNILNNGENIYLLSQQEDRFSCRDDASLTLKSYELMATVGILPQIAFEFRTLVPRKTVLGDTEYVWALQTDLFNCGRVL